jgi:hypothetical protein
VQMRAVIDAFFDFGRFADDEEAQANPAKA